MNNEIRLVGLAREAVLDEDSKTQFRRQQAEERQRKLDADKAEFYARNGKVVVVPPGVSGEGSKEYGHNNPPPKRGTKLDKIIARSVDDTVRRKVESGQRFGRERKVTCAHD